MNLSPIIKASSTPYIGSLFFIRLIFWQSKNFAAICSFLFLFFEPLWNKSNASKVVFSFEIIIPDQIIKFSNIYYVNYFPLITWLACITQQVGKTIMQRYFTAFIFVTIFFFLMLSYHCGFIRILEASIKQQAKIVESVPKSVLENRHDRGMAWYSLHYVHELSLRIRALNIILVPKISGSIKLFSHLINYQL